MKNVLRATLILGLGCMLLSSGNYPGFIKGFLMNKNTRETLANTKMNFIMNDTIIRSLVTDEEGYFSVKNIRPGKYNIKVSVDKYAGFEKKKVIVYESTTCYLTIELKPD